MEPAGSPSADLQLRDFLSVVRRRAWMVGLVTAAILAVTVFYTKRQVPVYQAHARVLVRPIGPISYTSFFNGPVNLVTERGISTSVAVAERAATHIATDLTPEQLLGGLNVYAETDSEILDFGYSSPEPAVAQQGAQAFAEGYLDFRRDQALDQMQSQTEDLKTEADKLERKLATLLRKTVSTNDPAKLSALAGIQTQLSARYGILQQQIQNLTGSNSIQGGGGDILAPAELPLSPVSPNPARNYTLATMVGLALGMGLAFGLERLDDRLRDLRQDMERHLGAPVLATVPQMPTWKKREQAKIAALEAPRSATSEAYRSLRTNIQYLMRARDIHSVTVTSAMVGDGKTTTTANLAVVLALAGTKVIVVSCDLRKPRLHSFFGLENRVGLVNVLRDEVGLPDALQRTDIANLRFLACGAVPQDPAELLSSVAMEDLVGVLTGAADIVIFDSPPVLAVADALVLGVKTDGVVVVADASRTTRSDLRRVREEIEQVGGVVLGGVVNSLNPNKVRYYSREYRRRYGAYYDDPTGEERTVERMEAEDGREDAGVSAAPDPIWS